MLDFQWTSCGTKTQDNMSVEVDRCQISFIPKDVHHVESHSPTTRRMMSAVDTLWGMKKTLGLLGIAMLLTVGTTSCSSSSADSPDTSVSSIELVPASKVIDVRTSEEFAEGHVKGARNLDIQNGDFEAALKDLDKEANYSVYCRSGNRSAAAVEIMRNEGFTNVVDLGALEDAAKALALPIVQN